MKKSFNEFSVLVGDDSQLVIKSVSLVLRKLGFTKIDTMSKAKYVISACKQRSYDLIICDYNFVSEINGYQILEELRHYGLLSPSCIFMFLTGENDKCIVRSILDSRPDDYLLKPLNLEFVKQRINSTVLRKQTLLPIFKHLSKQDHQGVVNACDVLLQGKTQYATLVAKYKAEALLACKQFQQARLEYEKLLKDNKHDWIKTGLATSLIATDNANLATEVLSTVDNKKSNPYYFDELSHLASHKNDLPAALAYLEKSVMLLDAGTERELIVSNLSLSILAYDKAVSYMERYYRKNRNTFRNNDYIKLQKIRVLLYSCSANKASARVVEKGLASIKPLLTQLQSNESLKSQYQLIDAHIALLNQNYSLATEQVKSVCRSMDGFHFYDYYQLIFILEQLGFLDQAQVLIQKSVKSISENQHQGVYRSQFHMLESKMALLKQKVAKIEQLMSKINDQLKGLNTRFSDENASQIFEQYAQVLQMVPYSSKIALAIVNFVSQFEFRYAGQLKLVDVLVSCDGIVSGMFSKSALENAQYSKKINLIMSRYSL